MNSWRQESKHLPTEIQKKKGKKAKRWTIIYERHHLMCIEKGIVWLDVGNCVYTFRLNRLFSRCIICKHQFGELYLTSLETIKKQLNTTEMCSSSRTSIYSAAKKVETCQYSHIIQDRYKLQAFGPNYINV